MTSSTDGHLTDKQLLLYVDGELASRETARVRTHLQACWTCRARLGDLEIAIKDLIAFRSQVLLPLVPAPPDPWAGMEKRFEGLDKVVPKKSLVEQLTSFLRFAVLPPRRLVFGGLVLLAVVTLLCLPSQRTITASELLARVVAAQTAELRTVPAPVLHQRLRVRRKVTASGERSTTDFDSWEDESRGRFRQTGSSTQVLAELRAICTTNQLDWQSPLSAAGYERWRNSLPAKHESIAVANGADAGESDPGDERLALTTTARSQATDDLTGGDGNSNRITQAELVVRTADWHPVEERLWVNGREYEIAELDYKVLPLSQVDALVFAEPVKAVEPVKIASPQLTAAPAAFVNHQPDPDETEMAVRYGLHQLEADLGEPVDIRRDPTGKILVGASEASPQLQAQLKVQLASLPNVELEIAKPSAPACGTCLASLPAVTENALSPALTIAPAANPNEKHLEEIFGDARAQESYTKDVLALSGDALSHCFALRNLALRYPPQVEAGLTAAARNQLQEMVDDHFAVLIESLSHLQGLLRPLMEALTGSGAGDAETAREAEMTGHDSEIPGLAAGASGLGSGPLWQDRSFQVLGTMRKADLLVRSLLTNNNNPLPADQIIPPLRQALVEQQRALKQYKGQALTQNNMAGK